MKMRAATIIGGHMTRISALEKMQAALYDLDIVDDAIAFPLRYGLRHPDEVGHALSVSDFVIMHSAATLVVEEAQPHFKVMPGMTLKVVSLCGSEPRLARQLLPLSQYKTAANLGRAVVGPHRAGHLRVLGTNFAEVPQPQSVTLLPRISRLSTTRLLKEMNDSGLPALRVNASRDEFYPLRILPELAPNPDIQLFTRVVTPDDTYEGQPIGHWHDSPLAFPKGWLDLVNREFLQTDLA